MQRAGSASAAIVIRKFSAEFLAKTAVFTGPGNNGGDGWVFAAAMAKGGHPVEVVEVVPAKSPDAAAERSAAVKVSGVSVVPKAGEARLVIDALLGTGST